MKINILLLLLVGTFSLATFTPISAVTSASSGVNNHFTRANDNGTTSKFQSISAETGKKLSFKQRIAMKFAQKFLKNKAGGNGSISKGLYIVLAIIGLGWVAMGVLDDWSGNNWIIGLVLSLLFVLPGIIFALIKMNSYY